MPQVHFRYQYLYGVKLILSTLMIGLHFFSSWLFLKHHLTLADNSLLSLIAALTNILTKLSKIQVIFFLICKVLRNINSGIHSISNRLLQCTFFLFTKLQLVQNAIERTRCNRRENISHRFSPVLKSLHCSSMNATWDLLISHTWPFFSQI